MRKKRLAVSIEVLAGRLASSHCRQTVDRPTWRPKPQLSSPLYRFELNFVLRAEGPAYPLPVSKAPDYRVSMSQTRRVGTGSIATIQNAVNDDNNGLSTTARFCRNPPDFSLRAF